LFTFLVGSLLGAMVLPAKCRSGVYIIHINMEKKKLISAMRRYGHDKVAEINREPI